MVRRFCVEVLASWVRLEIFSSEGIKERMTPGKTVLNTKIPMKPTSTNRRDADGSKKMASLQEGFSMQGMVSVMVKPLGGDKVLLFGLDAVNPEDI
ncbi:hypothetical protein VNO78_34281 [Psophocarpus tetragonolobus]|uniref:Uncharacterized protein n=1 Tax=Psophocarpus tetragonolobus TaxID=3891 RepID=A0AAN9P253_PSOTE